jgi:hypothetical protein
MKGKIWTPKYRMHTELQLDMTRKELHNDTVESKCLQTEQKKNIKSCKRKMKTRKAWNNIF